MLPVHGLPSVRGKVNKAPGPSLQQLVLHGKLQLVYHLWTPAMTLKYWLSALTPAQASWLGPPLHSNSHRVEYDGEFEKPSSTHGFAGGAPNPSEQAYAPKKQECTTGELERWLSALTSALASWRGASLHRELEQDIEDTYVVQKVVQQPGL